MAPKNAYQAQKYIKSWYDNSKCYMLTLNTYSTFNYLFILNVQLLWDNPNLEKWVPHPLAELFDQAAVNEAI